MLNKQMLLAHNAANAHMGWQITVGAVSLSPNQYTIGYVPGHCGSIKKLTNDTPSLSSIYTNRSQETPWDFYYYNYCAPVDMSIICTISKIIPEQGYEYWTLQGGQLTPFEGQPIFTLQDNNKTITLYCVMDF